MASLLIRAENPS